MHSTFGNRSHLVEVDGVIEWDNRVDATASPEVSDSLAAYR